MSGDFHREVILVYLIVVSERSKDERVHYTDHKKWVAQQYPPAKYDNTNMKIVKPKHFAAHIGKPDPKGASSW